MSKLDRRRFLQAGAAIVPAAAWGSLPLAARAATGQSTGLDAALLGALGEAVLPGELGEDGRRRVLAAFERWLEAYRPAAEMNHGYGTGEIRYTTAHPGPGWAAQLTALDLESRQRWSRSFADLDDETRRRMVSRQIGRDGIDRLGSPALATHVAVGLLAYFYSSPSANDLCHRSVIGKRTCRPLRTSPNQPAPLRSGG